jgi:hypothetical protein
MEKFQDETEVPDFLEGWEPKMSVEELRPERIKKEQVEQEEQEERLSPRERRIRAAMDKAEAGQRRVRDVAKGPRSGVSESRVQALVDAQNEKARALMTGQGYSEEEATQETQLQLKQDILAKQEELISAEKKQKEAIEDSNAVLMETQIEINNVGSAFEQWMLNPINVFQQKIMGVKEQFSGIVDSLKGKKVDLEEKFGLKTSEEASAKRSENLKASLKRDEKLLSMAQTPEEEIKVRERMAGKAEQLAELSEGPQKEQFAKKAVGYYEKAEESAAKAEELQIEKAEIEQENARENLAEYEKLVQNAETAGSRTGYLEQLKEAYMSLGPEYQEKAIQAQEDWKQSKVEAAAEESENFKRIAEANEIQVELLTRVAEALDSAATATKEQMHIPPDSAGYADVTS